ncbi:MAG: CARDB domain-containing protein [Bacteroidota bacterium]
MSNLQVRNIGNATAGSSHVGYYLSTNTTITSSDYRIGEDFVRSLSAGASSTESFAIDLNSLTSVPKGTYYFGIIVDDKNEVRESNGNDNTCYHTSPRVTISDPCD